MRIPAEIQGEWSSLGRSENPTENLRSIEKVRKWLDGATEALEQAVPGAPPKGPKMFGHGSANVRGVTHVDFDGVDMATLRFWLEWWAEPERTQWGSEEAGRDPREQITKIRREIEARERP
jgi:hypothetical protein